MIHERKPKLVAI